MQIHGKKVKDENQRVTWSENDRANSGTRRIEVRVQST